MKAMIIGKERRKGTKKDGTPYDNTIVHVTYKKFGVEGSAAETLFVKAENFSPDRIVVGQTCEFDRDRSGFLCAFDVIPAK